MPFRATADMDHIFAVTSCNVRLQDAARFVFSAEDAPYRRTATDQEARFPCGARPATLIAVLVLGFRECN